jgi:hypothetical protein
MRIQPNVIRDPPLLLSNSVLRVTTVVQVRSFQLPARSELTPPQPVTLRSLIAPNALVVIIVSVVV